MRTRALLFSCVLLLLSSPVRAATTVLSGPGDFAGPTTTIDFDDQSHGTAANTLYGAFGVEFRYDTAGSPVPIFDWAGISRSTTSAPNVIATVDGLNGSTFSDTLDLVFSTTVTEVGAWFGNDQGLAAASFPVTLTVFDASDTLLGSTFVSTNQNTSVDQFIGLRSDDPIARAQFTYNVPVGDLSVVLDDVQFSYVPEPGSAVLLALGLAGIAARRRR